MANKINYQKLMEDLIKENCMDNKCTPRLLLHSCCGPCSTYCIQTLSEYFKVTVFYYNPNIYPPEEYHMRAQEQKRFIDEFPVKNQVDFVEGGMEAVPEGGERCFKCYRLRLEESAQYAREHGFDFFTTTLSISPLKNAEKLNEIGKDLESQYGVRYLFSDFKKKEGYKKSTEISKQYDMYRQYYCGCVFSKEQRDREIAARG
jgi:predicted adenine nucleotide alpha hydrolase (AANH) superfamily ATPase